jgi:enamine deaminase RidA (YjgF/YER057c/UK114 family)
MNETNRRKFLRRGATTVAVAGIAASSAKAQEKPVKRVIYRNGKKPEKTPLFNGTVAYGNLIFIAGIGYHQEGDIKVHTEHVLQQIKEQLESAGSSMEKVLKCNVYLNDLKDYVSGQIRP